MLCRKCNSIIRADEDVCKNCGAAVREAHNLRRRPRFFGYLIVAVLLLGSAAIVFLYSQDMLNFDFFSNAMQTETELPAEDDSGAEQTGTEMPESPEITPAVRDEAARQELLATMHAAAISHVSQSQMIVPFISHSGYLFDAAAEHFVTQQMLVQLFELDEELLDDEKLILFLRPSDLAVFDETQLPSLDEMTVFVAHETVTGIGLYSVHGFTEIFRENLNAVIASYIPLAGAAVRPSSSEPVFMQTREAVALVEQSNNFDVRYLAHDSNFVFVTVSTRGESHILRHHIFMREEDRLEHSLTGFAGSRHPYEAINQNIPNFNFELLPDFSLGQNNLQPSNLYGVFDHIFDPYHPLPVFVAQASSPSVALVVFADSWQIMWPMGDGVGIENVSGWQQAEQFLRENNFPTYILRQED